MVIRRALSSWPTLQPVALGIVFCALIGAGSAAGAPSAEVEILHQFAWRSPFPGSCGLAGFSRGTQWEPTVAVNPRDARNVVVSWIQDDGRTNIVAASRDGGRTWARVLVPGLGECVGGVTPGAGDPWLSFGPDGVAYLGGGGGVATSGGSATTFMSANTSRDGGFSWSNLRTVQPLTGPYWDKPAVTANPRRPGRAYYVFALRDQREGVSTGATYFSRTVDGGQTWSAPRAIFTSPTQTQWPGTNVIAVPAGGVLVNVAGFATTQQTGGRVPLLSLRSSDGGGTWSRPQRIADVPNNFVTQRDTGNLVSFPPLIQSVATGPDGTVFVVWQSLDSPRSARILLSRSGNGGRSWSAPRAVARSRSQLFMPIVGVAGDGTVGVIYYDDAADRRGDSEWTTDVRFSWSGDHGRTWRARRLAGPFDLNRALVILQVPDGPTVLRIADYNALAGLPHGFAAAFTQARPKARIGRSTIFFARIRTRR